MSDICTIRKSTLDGIAEAIQGKTGESGRMLPSEMAGKIEALPSQPAKGLVFSEYDSDGYPHKAEFVGEWTEIPNYLCQGVFGGTENGNLNKKITSIITPNSITRIGNYGFDLCRSLTSIIISEAVTEIGTRGLNGCTGLTAITIPSTITTLGNQCFQSLSNCLSVTFSGNVPNIPSGCFNVSSKIMLYDFSHATAIPSLYSVASLGHASGCVIRIPLALSDQTLGTGNGWESATNWSALTNVAWEAV